MDDGIDPAHRLSDRNRIAQVAAQLAQTRAAPDAAERLVAVQVQVQNPYLVTRIEELRHQRAADVSGAAGDQYLSILAIHEVPTVPLFEQRLDELVGGNAVDRAAVAHDLGCLSPDHVRDERDHVAGQAGGRHRRRP